MQDYALELSWRFKKSINTVGCPIIFELLKVNKLPFVSFLYGWLLISCAHICVHVADLEFLTQYAHEYRCYGVSRTLINSY